MNLWERLISALTAMLKKQAETLKTVNLTKALKWTGYVDPKVQSFVDKIRPMALAIEASYGIPWRFAMVQAAHESRYGESGLTVDANNLFGVTGDTWAREGKPVVWKETRESSAFPPDKIHYWNTPGDIVFKAVTPAGGTSLIVKRPFRKYEGWAASLEDWAMRIEAQYPKAMLAAKVGDFAGFAKALEDGGYATDRDNKTGELVYAKKLTEVFTALEDIA